MKVQLSSSFQNVIHKALLVEVELRDFLRNFSYFFENKQEHFCFYFLLVG